MPLGNVVQRPGTIAYLDRINVGFAALTMNHELGPTSQQRGLLSGIFFWGYLLFEVPSNLMLRGHWEKGVY